MTLGRARLPFVTLIVALTVTLTLTVTPLARAASGDEHAPDPLKIELLTMGPGEHPFFKFGHNAIRIRDTQRGTDTVYNYGTFSFDSPTLLRDFFKGRLKYWLSKESMTITLEHYEGEGRGIRSQELALAPERKRAMKQLLDRNARPENRAYKYDYFFDNCSTRLRDVIDVVTSGQLAASMQVPARQSLRDHALRATADYLLEYLVLSIALGPLVDRPITAWQEAFLPEMLTDAVRHASIRDQDGTPHPLVLKESVLLEQRDTRLAAPPRWLGRFLGVGIVGGLGLFGLARWARRSRTASFALGSILVGLGLLTGALGVALSSLWAFTDHAVAYRNQNVLLLSPLALALPWVGVRMLTRGVDSLGALRWPSLAMLGSALLALVLKGVPFEWQDNAHWIALFLPIWFGLGCAAAAAHQP